jgi:hypothetical protein
MFATCFKCEHFIVHFLIERLQIISKTPHLSHIPPPWAAFRARPSIDKIGLSERNLVGLSPPIILIRRHSVWEISRKNKTISPKFLVNTGSD